MMIDPSYQKAFLRATLLHGFLALLLVLDLSFPQAQMQMESKGNEINFTKNTPAKREEIVKAVSVDQTVIDQTVQRLKQERLQKIQAEKMRQLALAKEAEIARQHRIQEQQRVAKLKEEANQLALAQKKKIAAEQQRLKELMLEKEQETNRLKELKDKQLALEKKQQAELKKIEELKKEAELKKVQEQKTLAEKMRAEKAQAELEKNQAEEAERARLEAQKKAIIASEVDKYKALIVNAISRQWILPDNIDNHLSSQFRIRLAPDGAVIEVSLARSSGDPILDRSAQTAIYKASPLPVPTDSETFDLFRDITLTVRPENVRG